MTVSVTVSVTVSHEFVSVCALVPSNLPYYPFGALQHEFHRDSHVGQTCRSAAWFTGGFTAAALLSVASAGDLAPICLSMLQPGSNIGIARTLGVVAFTTCTAIAVAMRKDKSMTARQQCFQTCL